uniref:hypothetical protein n=1 Tax=Sphingomonas populi TaxID=2484750 RepID=UPI0019D0BDB6|nr:hypothetical protein [Sphingomonas populi]
MGKSGRDHASAGACRTAIVTRDRRRASGGRHVRRGRPSRRAKLAGPVFLPGTSQGSIAAMNGAAHAPAGSIAGVVLTESVSVMGGSGETVFDASPERVRVPALIVANRDDRCDVAPPGAAPKIAAAMTASRDVRVLMVAGGVTRSAKDCGSLTPHGYYGIEDVVVGKISGWMEANGG